MHFEPYLGLKMKFSRFKIYYQHTEHLLSSAYLFTYITRFFPTELDIGIEVENVSLCLV